MERFLSWVITVCIRRGGRCQLSADLREDAAYWRCREIVVAEDKTPNVSGEWKRHQAYAKMLSEFPDISARKLSYIIERTISWGWI